MENNLLALITEVGAYLEDKYNEKFIIKNLVSDSPDPVNPNKAYAYPEGFINEWFAVRLDTDDTGTRIFTDGYGFVLAERVILPEYKEWISEVIPDGKIAIYIENENEVTNGDYSAGFNYEEFVKVESPYAINITVLAGSYLLADINSFFEKISRSIDEKLDRKQCYKINFAFSDENLDNLEISKYRRSSSFTFSLESDKFVAFSKVFIVEEMSQADIYNELKDEFTDDMEFDIPILEDEDGEGNE